MKLNLHGILPPIPTPFRDDEVDLVSLKNNVARWMKTGLAGLVVLGSNGEAPLIEDEEAFRVLEAAREHVPGDRTFIAGAARESTRATIAAVRRAADAGADAVLVRTPSYFKSQMTGDVFVRHYTEVADASPVPVILYNVTIFTGVNLQPAAVARLAEHPNIVGVKESGGDIAQIGDLVAATPSDFEVIVGSAPTMYASFCVGAVGAVVAIASVVPDLCVKLYELFQQGRHAEAVALQRRLTPLARSVTGVYGAGGLKAALDLAGYVGGQPRRPLPPATPQAIEVIRGQLVELGGA
jgi:4-hydroxy-tetrahydrodipicolinate synthase